jgi:hypothetical protein
MRELSNSACHKHWLLRAGRRNSSQLPHLRKYVADHSEEPWPNYQKLHDDGSGTVPQFHRLLSKGAKISPRGVPQPGPSLQYLLGLTEVPSKAHEHGYWCISFVNRQAHRPRLVPPGSTRTSWPGFQTLQLKSSTTLGSKPRHLVTLSPRQGKYAGSLHVRRAQS